MAWWYAEDAIATTTLILNRWHTITATRKAGDPNDTWTLWNDGVRIGTGTHALMNITGVGVTMGTAANNPDMLVEHAAVWRRVLTPAEIRAVAAAKTPLAAGRGRLEFGVFLHGACAPFRTAGGAGAVLPNTTTANALQDRTDYLFAARTGGCRLDAGATVR